MYGNQSMPQPTFAAEPVGKPQSTLESAVNSARNAAEELQATVDQLAMRLQVVMAPPVPQPPPTSTNGRSLAAVDQPHSAIVVELYALRGRLETLTIQINAMASCLET
jgi:hypothetical protein